AGSPSLASQECSTRASARLVVLRSYAHRAMNITLDFKRLIRIGYLCQELVDRLAFLSKLRDIVLELISHCLHRLLGVRKVGKADLFERLQDQISAFETLVVPVDESFKSRVESLSEFKILGQLAQRKGADTTCRSNGGVVGRDQLFIVALQV